MNRFIRIEDVRTKWDLFTNCFSPARGAKETMATFLGRKSWKCKCQEKSLNSCKLLDKALTSLPSYLINKQSWPGVLGKRYLCCFLPRYSVFLFGIKYFAFPEFLVFCKKA